MANVAHSTLTGSELHEPKGADTALAGTVYVANGAGSGSWSDVGTASFTGMVADFITPIAPNGWLELNGAIISTSTFSGLYGVMAMQTSGTRTNGSAVITSIPSTTQFRIGYYVFGTGISSGTTIVSIDSASQVTLSNPASGSGTAGFAVSPWLLNTGTIQLPDVTTAGRFRRSRSSSTKVGDLQANQNLSHTHGVSGNTGTDSGDHVHSFSGTTGIESADHTHTYQTWPVTTAVVGAANFAQPTGNGTGTTSGVSAHHTHNFSGVTAGISANHFHTFNVTSTAQGGTEARPNALVVITCVKT